MKVITEQNFHRSRYDNMLLISRNNKSNSKTT